MFSTNLLSLLWFDSCIDDGCCCCCVLQPVSQSCLSCSWLLLLSVQKLSKCAKRRSRCCWLGRRGGGGGINQPIKSGCLYARAGAAMTAAAAAAVAAPASAEVESTVCLSVCMYVSPYLRPSVYAIQGLLLFIVLLLLPSPLPF